jgi:adenylate cyclase
MANEEVWRTVFGSPEGHPKLKSYQRFHRWLPPGLPRAECEMCFAPYEVPSAWLMRLLGKVPSATNPRVCTACNYFLRTYPGGAEVELSILFVDVRGSGKLAAGQTPTEFGRLLQAFYTAATQAVISADGYTIDIIGDALLVVWPPGFAGKDHARKSIQAAEKLLRIMVPVGLNESPLPIGIGVHTGIVYVGTFEGAKGGSQEVRVVGDNVNIAASLSQMAGPGEALMSDAACEAAGLSCEGLQTRQLTLKGKDVPIAVRILSGVSPLFTEPSTSLSFAN